MRFVICIHDATPAFERETRLMLRDLAPLVGRRLAFGVVPDWDGEWPLSGHVDFCRLIGECSDELLLHGWCHRRTRGAGAITWLTGGSDEMNGLDPAATRCTIERGQRVFRDVFGEPARGFVAPAWQRGLVRPGTDHALEFVMGFLSVETSTGQSMPLATSTWDCGRWRALGHVGRGLGRLLRMQTRRVPVLALHPRDVESGFWPTILRSTADLLESGYEASTVTGLLEARARACA